MHFIDFLNQNRPSENFELLKQVSLFTDLCNPFCMKHFYLLTFLLIFSSGLAQDKQVNPGDIVGFTLYPNPVVNGKVYIKTQANAPKKVLIFDVLGTLVIETTILGKELNLTDLDAGVYVLRVFEKNKVATRKLIVK
jgi:hypothetical protein